MMGLRTLRTVLAIGFLASGLATPALATPRAFPSDSFQVMLTAVSDLSLVVDGQVATMSPAAIIFGPTNTTLVRGALVAPGWIRIEFDGTCAIKRIWVLNSDEVAPVPFWTSLFGSGFVPPTCPAAGAAAAASPSTSTPTTSTTSTPTSTTSGTSSTRTDTQR
jgi:hypothetical protein